MSSKFQMDSKLNGLLATNCQELEDGPGSTLLFATDHCKKNQPEKGPSLRICEGFIEKTDEFGGCNPISRFFQNRQYGKLGEVEMAIQPNQQFKMIVHQEKKKKKIKEETSVVEKAPKRNEDHLRSGIPVAKKKHRK